MADTSGRRGRLRGGFVRHIWDESFAGLFSSRCGSHNEVKPERIFDRPGSVCTECEKVDRRDPS